MIDTESLETKIIDVLKHIYDPEIPVNIYDLGLIYKIEARKCGKVSILMTLTTPNCPVAEWFPHEVKQAVSLVEGVTGVELNLTFNPPWSKDMLSEEAMLVLGFL
jgi:FeS assembly SUF system protein